MKKSKVWMKFISAVCALSFVGAAVAYGEELPALSIKKAVDSAAAINSDLLRSDEEKIVNNDAMRQVKEKIYEAMDEATILSLAAELARLELKGSLFSDNERDKKDRITFSITQFFITIIAAEQDLALYDTSIAIAEKDVKIAKTKHRLGLISDAELDSALNSYEKMQNNRTAKEMAISKAFISLNEIMGKSVNNRYALDLEYAYKPIGNVSIDAVTSKAISNCAELITLEWNLDKANKDLKEYDSWTSKTSEETLEIAVTQAERAIADRKAELRSKVLSAYNAILEMETEYDANQLELAGMQKQLTMKETQLSLGLITELEVEKYKAQIAQLEETIRRQVYNHGFKMEQFQKPHLL